MRDIKRIKPFLDEVAKYWEAHPDLRFGQLIVNVYSQANRDPFFYEEADTLELFEKMFGEGTEQNLSSENE